VSDTAVTQLYSNHYRSLVRLADLTVRDEPTAEEVVQECFIAMHDGRHRLRDDTKALAYLRQAVVNRSRWVLRHRKVVDRNPPGPAPDMPSAEQDAITRLEHSAVVAALRSLPDRQRQALVLRYYADLSEAQIAEMMGISTGAVKSHTAPAWLPCGRSWTGCRPPPEDLGLVPRIARCSDRLGGGRKQVFAQRSRPGGKRP
jgi:RNA polymerase sigma-70 factor (sigma-E family)